MPVLNKIQKNIKCPFSVTKFYEKLLFSYHKQALFRIDLESILTSIFKETFTHFVFTVNPKVLKTIIFTKTSGGFVHVSFLRHSDLMLKNCSEHACKRRKGCS